VRSSSVVKRQALDPADILAGYDAVAALYPWIPPMIIWRGWEYAAYRRFALPEPILDVGCGDGRFFRLVFPQASEVDGVEADIGVADGARRSGVYREVHVCPAHTLPLPGRRFASVFANCSLEHMDRLPDVLGGIFESLEPGGPFLFSVVTDRFREWSPLPLMLRAAGDPDRAAAVQRNHETYHHLVNAFPVEGWIQRLHAAGFEMVEHIVVLPELTGRLFLLADQLWHLTTADKECGDELYRYFSGIDRFHDGLREILGGLLLMERTGDGIGAVFCARRPA
jgi:SAM-dependent methyltransferase